MSSISCVNELEDAVIGYICDMLDSIWIVELLNVGNRLLTVKLCSRSGVSRYCDVGEYGPYIGPLQVILPQLKGLKTISLTSKENAYFGSLLVDVIPSTVTSIELKGDSIFEDCFEKRNGKDEYFFDFTRRFPSLQSLTLLYKKSSLSSYTEYSDSLSMHEIDKQDQNKKVGSTAPDNSNQELSSCKYDYGGISRKQAHRSWLDVHLPHFPPTLTRLCLNATARTTRIERVRFPRALEHLEIGCIHLGSLAWIFTLPFLLTLKLSSILYVDAIDEPFESQKHPTLSRLHLTMGTWTKERELINLSHRLKTLLPAIPHLKDFCLVPTSDPFGAAEGCFERVKLSTPCTWLNDGIHLRTLSFPLSEEASFPRTLVKLSIYEPRRGIHTTLSREQVTRLPPMLTVLKSNLKLRKEDVELLPRTLTSMTIHFESTEFYAYPPLLTHLENCYISVNKKNLKKISEHLPHLMVLCQSDDDLHLKTEIDLSLYKTGWTNLVNASWMEDFDALHRLVVEFMKFPKKSPQKMLKDLWEGIYYSSLVDDSRINQLPLTSLNWFRLRGLCSFPHRIGEVSFWFLLRTNLRSDLFCTKTFFKWAGPYIENPDWRDDEDLNL